MKRMFVFFMILSIIICLVACSSEKKENDETRIDNPSALSSDVNESSNASEVSMPDNLPPDVPYVLAFDSFEKIAELRGMIDKSEEDIDNYLDSTGFNMNGLSSKEDIIGLFDRINDLVMLHLDDTSGYDMNGISYYIDYGYVMSTYSKDSNIVRFVCYINEENSTNISIDADNMNSSVAATSKLTILNSVVDLYEIKSADSPFALSGSLETPNSHIKLFLPSQGEKGLIDAKISANIIKTTLADLLEKK